MKVLKIFLHILKYVLLIILPIFALMRVSIYIYEHGFNDWLAVLGGMITTVIIFIIYFYFVKLKFTKKAQAKSFKTSLRNLKIVSLSFFVLMFAYVGYCTLYISDKNIKTNDLKTEFKILHPIIRLSIGSLIVIDNKFIATDFSREVKDYKKFNMKENEKSLHLIQEDGYAHALDVRTNGRSRLRNFFIEQYFKLMGFDTLRHIGTSDHLHVQLNLPNK